MAAANTAPLGGMRDFLPLDVLRRRYVVATIERVYQRFGFEPLETPAMERLETLLGKYGEEGDQLIFRVLKRGEALQRARAGGAGENALSDGGLRYDLTVPLARVVAAYRNQLPRIFKRYQIQPVFRADRPAKGRFREFFQCDVDIVGSRSALADAEVIGAVATVLQELGFSRQEDFTIRLNHRGILRGLMHVAGIPEAQEGGALVALDKLDKIGLDGVREDLEKRAVAPEAATTLLDILAQTPAENDERLVWLDALLQGSEVGRASAANLREVFLAAGYGPAAARIRIDPYLARGLSYYTGPIFEIAFPGLGVSGGGGGRYDGLIGMFIGQQIPASGFSLGLERILLIMEERGMFPERLAGQPQALVTQSGPERLAQTLTLAQRLREADLRIDLYPDFDRFGPQFHYAERRGIRYALLLGEREVADGVVAVKDLVSGDQEDVAADAVADWLRARL
jgi:histidyl-tRNA synthetase